MEGLFGSFRKGGGGNYRQSASVFAHVSQSPGATSCSSLWLIVSLRLWKNKHDFDVHPVTFSYCLFLFCTPRSGPGAGAPRCEECCEGGASSQTHPPTPPPHTAALLTLRCSFLCIGRIIIHQNVFYLRHKNAKLLISNIFRSATILPLCTKDLINVHTYKIQYALPMYSTCAKCMAFKHDMELISGVQTANTKASWFFF